MSNDTTTEPEAAAPEVDFAHLEEVMDTDKQRLQIRWLKHRGLFERFARLWYELQGPPKYLNRGNAFISALAQTVPQRRRRLRIGQQHRDEETAVVDKRGINFDRDLEWAYAHLGRKVKAHNAPSVPAWELLEFARENKEVFFKSFLAWSERRRKDQLGQDAFVDDKRAKFGLLDRLDEALQRDLTNRLASWMRKTPDSVVAVLAQMGWRCEPMAGQSAAATVADHPEGAAGVSDGCGIPV